MSKKTVTLLVGIMTSGKSTYLKTIEEKTTISFDELIMGHFETTIYNNAWMYYTLLDYNEQEELMERLPDRLVKALNDDEVQDIYIDMMNLTARNRKSWIKAVGRSATIKALYFPITLKTALERNKKRQGKFIPVEVIKSSFAKLEIPTCREGFRSVKLHGLMS